MRIKKIIEKIQFSSQQNFSIKMVIIWAAVALAIDGVLFAMLVGWSIHANKDSFIKALAPMGALLIALPTAYITIKRQQALEEQNDLTRNQINLTREQINLTTKQNMEQNDLTRTSDLHSRYEKAANLLSSDSNMSKLAGVRSMAALADDWKRKKDYVQQQTCVDTLIDYLRTEYIIEKNEYSGEDKYIDGIVRKNITDEICKRLQKDISENIENWSNLTFDFSNTELYYPRFTKSLFLEPVNFDGAKFHGETTFKGVKFNGKSTFRKTFFSHMVNISNTKFCEETIFSGAIFYGVTSFIKTEFCKKPSFNKAKYVSPLIFTDSQGVDKNEVMETMIKIDSLGKSITYGDENFVSDK